MEPSLTNNLFENILRGVQPSAEDLKRVADEQQRRAISHAIRENARLRSALEEIIADSSCSAYIAQVAEAALKGRG